MVFESLVVELVNRFLGDFIENLDTSQLSIGIWGGDVVLNNLYVKENLFDELDLPIKVRYGNIGKLTLKIPWKNLYTEPTIAVLDGLYVVAVPNSSVAYNEEKETKSQWESKQKELLRIEEAKKKEAEKNLPKDPKQDTFAEKLVTNVIKNLEVKVTNIHIRYEDSYTDPSKPFSVGVTLRELSCQTTDENWTLKIIKEAAIVIYKLLKLDSLSLYWNVDSKFYCSLDKTAVQTPADRVNIQTLLKNNIIDSADKSDYLYVIEPMTSNAHLRLHTKPEQDDFTQAKILLDVLFEDTVIALSKDQFQVLMEFIESFERMQLASRYRKYKPSQPRHKHARIWWQFAYTCVLEETVKRRNRMWSWTHIHQHRQMSRRYRDIYKTKLVSKPSADLLAEIQKCERTLDVFNLTMMRQQAEMQAKKELDKKQASGGGGWFGGWFGRGKAEVPTEEKSVSDRVQEIMTPEEKQKLYDAIGYQENVDMVFPKEYVATMLQVQLKSLRVKLKDAEAKKRDIMCLQLKRVSADLEQRPSANAIKLKASMQSVTILGLPATPAGGAGDQALAPKMLSSFANENGTFIDVLFETNPIDGACDTRIGASVRPVEVVFDANTVISLADFFKPPEHVHMVQLQAAAMAKLEQVKANTTTGLQYALDQRKFTEITVSLQPTYVIIPEGGAYKQDCRMIVIDLGQFSIATEKQVHRGEPSSPRLSMEELKQQAYDNFKLKLKSVQLLFVRPGEKWMDARISGSSPMHILKPMAINIDFYKSMLPDLDLPKMKILGELPSLSVMISDQRLLDILCLVQSVPLPESSAPAAVEDETEATLKAADVKNLPIRGDVVELATQLEAGGVGGPGLVDSKKESGPSFNSIDLELKFEIKEICLGVSQLKDGHDIPILKVVIESIGTAVTMRPYDMSVQAYLGGIYLQHTQFKALSDGPLVNLVNTPIIDGKNFKLLNVEVLMVQKNHPELATKYSNTLQALSVHFTALEILLHQEAILNVLEVAQAFQKALEKPETEKQATNQNLARRLSSVSSTSLSGAVKKMEQRRVARKKQGATELIDVSVTAIMDNLSVAICTNERLLTDVKIAGLEAFVTLQKSKTAVNASLKEITVFNREPGAIYPKILTFEGSSVFSAAIVVYNNATDGLDYCDMQCVDTRVALNTGCMKVVFLNKFVQDLLSFLNQFQAAKDKISEAGAAVKDKAASAAQDFSEKAPRVSLDIKLNAPVIIVPQNSMSGNAIVLDLGKLNVSNSFQVVGKKDSKGLPAVLDNMVIELTLLKIFRAHIMETTVKAECLILEPVSIEVKICRNLSTSWYHDHPDVEVSGKLHRFSILMSQGDFTTFMSLLSENLQEGASQATLPAASAQPQQPSAPPASRPATAGPGVNDRLKVIPEDGVLSETGGAVQVYSSMKAKLTLESISTELFSGNSDLSSGISVRDKSKSLARMQLTTVSVDVDMRSDQSMSARVSLHGFDLTDSREGRKDGITKVITQSSSAVTGVTDSTDMIQLKFEQDMNLNKDVDIKVIGVYVVVCPEYLVRLSDFFVKGMPAAPKALPPAAAAPVAAASPAAAASVAAVATQPAAVSQPVAAPEGGDIKLQFSLVKPEIVLVEDSTRLDTNALILGMQVDLALRMSSTLQTMKGSVLGLSIISCIYAPEVRESSKSQILSPVNIELQSSAPYGKNHHMAVYMSDVLVNVSSASIRTITATLSTMSIPSDEEAEDELSKIPKDLWIIKNIDECSFWFLKPAVEEKVSEVVENKELVAQDGTDADRGEQILLTKSRVIVKMLGGTGKRVVPFIITDMTLKNINIRNWSSRLQLACELTLEVAYYNELLCVWEPLLEPVEYEGGRHRPWELTVDMHQNEVVQKDDDDEMDSLPIPPPPKMSILVKSQDILLLTVTKTALDVFKNLGQSFGAAYNLAEPPKHMDEVIAPYNFRNESGMIVSLKLGDTFQLPANNVEGQVPLEPGQNVQLFNKQAIEVAGGEPKHGGLDTIFKEALDDQAKKIHVIMEDLGATRELRVMRAEKRAFAINHRAYPGEPWQIVCQIDASYGCKIITLRSIVQIKNCLPVAMELYYKLSDDAMGRCGFVEPDQIFNLPCDAAYSAPHEIYFKPTDGSYLDSTTGFKWKNVSNATASQIIECKSSKPELSSMYFTVKIESENILYEATSETTAKSYTVTLNPTVVFRNLLPLPVACQIEGSGSILKIDAGDKMTLTNACIGTTSIHVSLMYQSKDWSGRRVIDSKPDELGVWTFEAYEDGNRVNLDLGVHCDTRSGFQVLSLYCPYWMINKTERDLMYKAGDDFTVQHPANSKDIVFFLFKKSALAAKKASLRLADSEWSDRFSLDTVGSVGTVQCKFKSNTANTSKESKSTSSKSIVSVKIALSSTGLTKIITFSPFFTVVNQAKFVILFKEHTPNSEWVEIQPGSCLPYWPQHSGNNKQMVACVKGTALETKPFDVTESHTTLLQLYHDYGGINVECLAVEGAITITFQFYCPGFATALIVNHTTNCTIQYHQKDIPEQSLSLGPHQSALYTWQNPVGKRELNWTCGEKKQLKEELLKDDLGCFLANNDTNIYWVSFLDGMQRVLLFTEDTLLAKRAQNAGVLEQVDQEIAISLQGFGLSLVYNTRRKEIAYFGITSSGIIWEQQQRKRFKPMKLKHSLALEEGYQRYQMERETGSVQPGRRHIGKIDVDFSGDKMMMYKPQKIVIRRTFEYGIWLQYGTSAHQTQVHLKLHRLQLDNQLPGAVFRTVLTPIPPPKSVAVESVPKPFTELSILIRKSDFSNVMQFKYFKLLIQEMAVKVDQGFLNALLAMFAAGEVDEIQRKAAFTADCDLVNRTLLDDAILTSATVVKNFYDILHFSPLKIHLSFSLYGGDETEDANMEGDKKPVVQFNVLSLFLQSVGVVLTDIQDVVFKLAYFERQHTFYNQTQLIAEITRHYSQQAIKQMYVLVLGLDVLGNPFGVVRGLAEGIEDLFYEPYQGAIQGPEEFAEGLALGVRSLFGHAIGGAAGAVSRITGALGKGIATLTMDDEYQKKRREEMNKRPADLREGLARGGKGLVMGVVDGFTGVVLKPVEGAKQEGVGGFFKGVGKGLVGVFTRPASGVVDFASSSFDGIRRVAEMSDEVQRLRPARFLHVDGVVRPFAVREAEGNQILQDVEKGKFAKELYLGHIVVSSDGRNVLLATDKQVIFSGRGDVFGHWDSEWNYTWDLLKESPSFGPRGIQVLLKEKQKKLIGSGSIGKLVAVPEKDKKNAEALVNRMKAAMSASTSSLPASSSS